MPLCNVVKIKISIIKNKVELYNIIKRAINNRPYDVERNCVFE